MNQGFVGLAIVMVLASCLSLYYYLSLLVQIWFKPASRMSLEPGNAEDAKTQKWLAFVLAATSLAIGVIGPRWAQSLNFTVAKEKAQASRP